MIEEEVAYNNNRDIKTMEMATMTQQQAERPLLVVDSIINNPIQNMKNMEEMPKLDQDGYTMGASGPHMGKMEFGSSSLLADKDGTQEQPRVTPQALIKLNNEHSQLQQFEEDMSEYDEEQYEYEYDDLIVDDLLEQDNQLNPLPSFPLNADVPILISEDPPFSEKDLEEFINNDALDGNEEHLISEGTFHSIQNSTHSSSSFVNGMERLIVHQADKSTSNSSKRKMNDGVDDTATSETRVGKKTKI